MPIQLQADVELPRPVGECFRFLDDFANTPKWNSRCIEVRQTTDGPHTVGSKLHYRYKDPGREGEMTGEITSYEPDRDLVMRFTDRGIDVTVGFHLAANGAGTHVHHTIEIVPRSFLMRLMSPVIRGATRKQVQHEVEALRRLLD